MTKRTRLTDPDDDDDPEEPTHRPRRRIARESLRDRDDEAPRRQYAHGESDRLDGGRENFILAKADGGHRNAAGRPTGRPNVVTATLKKAIMLAAEDVGEDGEGKGGLQGYLRRLALNEPQAFTSLLRRILPVQVKADVDPQTTFGQILEAARARLAYEKSKVLEAKVVEGDRWRREYPR